jgi:hypothetical protein
MTPVRAERALEKAGAAAPARRASGRRARRRAAALEREAREVGAPGSPQAKAEVPRAGAGAALGEKRTAARTASQQRVALRTAAPVVRAASFAAEKCAGRRSFAVVQQNAGPACRSSADPTAQRAAEAPARAARPDKAAPARRTAKQVVSSVATARVSISTTTSKTVESVAMAALVHRHIATTAAAESPNAALARAAAGANSAAETNAARADSSVVWCRGALHNRLDVSTQRMTRARSAAPLVREHARGAWLFVESRRARETATGT